VGVGSLGDAGLRNLWAVGNLYFVNLVIKIW
jgi:hypothetical protein